MCAKFAIITFQSACISARVRGPTYTAKTQKKDISRMKCFLQQTLKTGFPIQLTLTINRYTINAHLIFVVKSFFQSSFRQPPSNRMSACKLVLGNLVAGVTIKDVKYT